MTSFAFIFGLMPLWFALGAGAVARRLIGTVTIVGMAFSSGFAIFLVPVLFVVVERLSHRLSGQKAAAGIRHAGSAAGEMSPRPMASAPPGRLTRLRRIAAPRTLHLFYFPLYCGLRFSMKARGPSRASSVLRMKR